MRLSFSCSTATSLLCVILATLRALTSLVLSSSWLRPLSLAENAEGAPSSFAEVGLFTWPNAEVVGGSSPLSSLSCRSSEQPKRRGSSPAAMSDRQRRNSAFSSSRECSCLASAAALVEASGSAPVSKVADEAASAVAETCFWITAMAWRRDPAASARPSSSIEARASATSLACSVSLARKPLVRTTTCDFDMRLSLASCSIALRSRSPMACTSFRASKYRCWSCSSSSRTEPSSAASDLDSSSSSLASLSSSLKPSSRRRARCWVSAMRRARETSSSSSPLRTR
mmetsp:Transcript_7244/g.20403  ORF Transcript_7244/g.20403 Transcript_7244/m.20403 type:complete len:285 (+) Transcript_7244:560-1414(+)